MLHIVIETVNVGSIPFELSRLSRLKEMQINYNKLTGKSRGEVRYWRCYFMNRKYPCCSFSAK
jgi:hypothetical protein